MHQDNYQSSARVASFEKYTVHSALIFSIAIAIFGCYLFLSNRPIEETKTLLPGANYWNLVHLERKNQDGWEYFLPVEVTLQSTWEEVQELVLQFSVSDKVLPVEKAYIEFENATCRLDAGEAYYLWDNGELRFKPQGDCNNLQAGTVLKGELVVELAALGSLAIFALDKGVGSLRIDNRSDPPFYALGRWVVDTSPPRGVLADRMARMWGIPHFDTLVAVWIFAASLLVALGGVSLGMKTLRWRHVVATACFSLVVSITYAFFIPPYQAPDEPDHFLAYMEKYSAAKVEDAADLARRSHFGRIHFNRWEQFLPRHEDNPYPEAWNLSGGHAKSHVHASNIERRSPLTAFIWDSVGRAFPQANAAESLLVLRITHALLWVACCVIGAWIIYWYREDGRVAFPLFLFFVPTLPFFSMFVSNYSFYTHIVTICGCYSLALLYGRRLSSGGLILGIVASLAVVASNSGVAILGWMGFVLAAHIITGINAHRGAGAIQRIARYWGGLALGLAVLLSFRGTQKGEGLSKSWMFFLKSLGFDTSWIDVLSSIEVVSLVVFAALLAGAFLEYLFTFTIKKDGKVHRLIQFASRYSMIGMVVMYGVLLVYSAFWIYEYLPNRIDADTERYLTQFVRGLITAFTFRQPDTMMSMTFWAGFGWHDSFFHPRVVQLFAGTAGIGLLLAMISSLKRWDRTLMLHGLLAGAFFSGILLAIAALNLPKSAGIANIHGRHLIGTYVLILSLAYTGFSPVAWRNNVAERIQYKSVWFPTRYGVESLMLFALVIVALFCLRYSSYALYIPEINMDMHKSSWILAFLFVFVVGFVAFLLQKNGDLCSPHMGVGCIRGVFFGTLVAIFALLIAYAVFFHSPLFLTSYHIGFYVVMAVCVYVACLVWAVRQSFDFLRSYFTPAALFIGVVIHIGVILFLMKRYFG